MEIIDSMQLTIKNEGNVLRWVDADVWEGCSDGIFVITPQGKKLAEYGEYIFKHEDGSFSIHEKDFKKIAREV